uniref:Neur_chan_LBD domain-containing protein n=1 Tax=Steinernema glaseri TaxID=37863 RepID=A0A1I7YLD1_9BILA
MPEMEDAQTANPSVLLIIIIYFDRELFAVYWSNVYSLPRYLDDVHPFEFSLHFLSLYPSDRKSIVFPPEEMYVKLTMGNSNTVLMVFIAAISSACASISNSAVPNGQF